MSFLLYYLHLTFIGLANKCFELGENLLDQTVDSKTIPGPPEAANMLT